MVRKFAAWWSAFDPQTEVPPRHLVSSRHRRPRPHIYTEAQTQALMAAAAQCRSPTGLRALTYTTLIGLLAATGLRPGEALALDRSDVDLQNGILFIRETKFGKSRLVPIAATTRLALAHYAARRDALCPHPQTPAFLLSERGRRLAGSSVRRMFVRLSRAVGLRPANGSPRAGRGPRAAAAGLSPLVRHRPAGGMVPRRGGCHARAAEACDVCRPHRSWPHLLVHRGRAGTADVGHRTPKRACGYGRCTMSPTTFPALLQQFFTERLLGSQGASPHTVGGYRDTFRLLLRFAAAHLHCTPSALRLEQLDAPLLEAFLEYLERERGNGARTRNQRLAALHGFFRYVALAEPARSLQCQRILAIPPKRFERGPVAFLTPEEAQALIAAPDAGTWIGRRDRTLLALALQTGLRSSEIRQLCCRDVAIGTGPHVRCLGKGRKTRCTPLRPEVAALLKAWLCERRGDPADPVFPSARGGGALSADALAGIVARHTATAGRACPSLKTKRVTPHTLRHAAAMALLQSGVDITVIALWLGHESTQSTEIYLHADMRLKEQALAHATSAGIAPRRFHAPDRLLTFLEGL